MDPGNHSDSIDDLHYEIEYMGKKFKRHVDQIRAFMPQEAKEKPNLDHQEKKPKKVHFFEKPP